MKTYIKFPDDLKLSSTSIKYLFISIIILLSFNYSFAQTYLTDGQQVPVFDPAETDTTDRYVYWDMTEINNSNNRLDIGVGVTHFEGSNNFINGNWYNNENNSNFNSEVTGDRFIYLVNNSNIINGFIFKNNDSTGRKDAVLTRGNGDLEIYSNSNGYIGDRFQYFNSYGTILAVGQFSTDNYEDAVILSNSGDTAKIYKGLANGKLDTIPYRYPLNDPYKLQLAQINSYISPYSIVYNTTSSKDELVYTKDDSLIILRNTNNNTLEYWLSIYTGIEDADFTVSDINNDGYNDILVFERFGGLKIYVNNFGTGFILGYVHSDYIFSVSAADFNKDGWNDIVINLESSVEIYLNTKFGDYFDEDPSSVYVNTYPVPVKLVKPGKSIVADLYNKGGLALIFSASPDQVNFNWNVENIWRINASNIDAVPAPPLLFKDLVLIGQHYRPRLHIYNRGDRDFQKYIIY